MPANHTADSKTGIPVPSMDERRADERWAAGRWALSLVRRHRRAIVQAPDRAAGYMNLGEGLRTLGQDGAAAAVNARALTLRPDYPQALCARSVLFAGQRRPRAALRLALRALAVDPAFPAGWDCLARLAGTESLDEVRLRAMLRSVRLTPARPEALVAFGTSLTDGDRVRGDARAREEGVGILQRALALDPASPEAIGALSGAAFRLSRFPEVLRLIRRLHRIDPQSANAYAMRSVVATMLGDFDAAIAHGRCAVLLAPGEATPWINLALGLHALQHPEIAAHYNRRAARLDPGGAVGRFNLSLNLLAMGDLARGWRLYEARWRMGGARTPDHAPLWDGTDPAGRRILLTAEQGQGDTLHFIRYAPLLAARGARVEAQVQPSLVRLVSLMPGVSAVHRSDEPPPPCDAVVPLLSLPRLFGTTLDTIPATPYLRAAPADEARWRERLAGEHRTKGHRAGQRRLKVGLVWAGDSHAAHLSANAVDGRRSLPLAALAPLASVPGIAWISLQKGAPAAQAGTPPPGMDLIDWMDEVTDFADTAALITQFDLVISVDTSVCHLVGGLGKPVWMLSRFDACWRWLIGRDDTPWYPTMRLFRQERPGDWEAVIARLATRLRIVADHRLPGAPAV
ncbi:tetratricopeptide repeat protein [Azospirillum argentinense]